MCVVTEVRKAHRLPSEKEIRMHHEEVTLRDKKSPLACGEARGDPCAPPRRSSLKTSSSAKRKSVRFAQDPRAETAASRTRSCCPEAVAEDFVLVTHQDADAKESNPQEDESTRPVLSEVCCLLTPSSEMTPQEKSHVWWQARDYEVFKGTARLISSEIRRRTEASRGGGRSSNGGSEGYASVLTRSLDSCRLTPLTQEDDDERHGSNPIPRRLFAYLTHWVRVGHSRRGLERWSVSSHSDNRNAAREDAIRAVLGEQSKLRVRAEEHVAGREAMAEGLRSTSRRATRSARLFALAIGQADAAAVGSDICDPTAVCSLETPPTPSSAKTSPRSVLPRAKIVIV